MAAAAPGVIRVMAEDTAYGKAPLFEQAGYAPIRYFFFMQRKPLEDLPAAPLPPGLELRPALPGHLRLLWEAKQEAFRDHWGHFTDTEADYQIWLNDPHNDLSLWQIAWDGDQVAGVAFNFINANDNAHYGFQRGQVRSLAVRRPWRGRGLGRALLVHSLHAHRERGMTEATLGVDAENPSGALKLYESVGFTVLNKDVLYQKQIP
jgi:ribosomal protein S18 acetylase RimI-like enzyme